MSEEGVSRRDFLKDITVLCASSVLGISGLELLAHAAESVYAEETMEAFIVRNPFSRRKRVSGETRQTSTNYSPGTEYHTPPV